MRIELTQISLTLFMEIRIQSDVPVYCRRVAREFVAVATRNCVISEFSSHFYTIIYICKVSQEERSIFWEVMVSVILRKILYVHVSFSERFPAFIVQVTKLVQLT
jgi:hypothetical protein